ncbi:hypothetical protein [Aureivirga sp. CE67]|uniref:hypothetical protein n=1 Tax=Aureivirga sp. CE67 TaxID=1788983 RepID=UPI0018CA2229|nr:hypothetical protein [Aureivirga sp. CE67]
MKNIIILTLLIIVVGCASSDNEQKFIKDYKLLKLDGELCENCILRVKKGHTYDILKDGQKVGEGDWDLENPLDFPGFVLHLENGPGWMIYESDTIIDYIDRNKK